MVDTHPTLEEMLDYLLAEQPNSFVRSLDEGLKEYGGLTENQQNALRRFYWRVKAP